MCRRWVFTFRFLRGIATGGRRGWIDIEKYALRSGTTFFSLEEGTERDVPITTAGTFLASIIDVEFARRSVLLSSGRRASRFCSGSRRRARSRCFSSLSFAFDFAFLRKGSFSSAFFLCLLLLLVAPGGGSLRSQVP